MRFTKRGYMRAIEQLRDKVSWLEAAGNQERADKRFHDLKLIKRRYFREC